VPFQIISLNILPFIKGVVNLGLGCKPKSSEDLHASYDAGSVVALSAVRFDLKVQVVRISYRELPKQA